MNGLIELPWLSVLLLLPLAGGLLCLLGGRRWAVVTVALEGLVALFLSQGGAPAGAAVWMRLESWTWIARYGARFSLALDGLALLLVWLTVILLATALGLSWRRYRQRGYYALLLVSCSGVLGVFLARDLLLFYLSWEIMLLPLIFCIALWGEAGRVRAAYKLLLYTLAGSLLMLLAFLTLFVLHGRQTGDFSFALQSLEATAIPSGWAPWLFGCLVLAFLIKVPVVPLHGWLPDAYAEAPVPVALLLSGVLAKTGVFALVRLVLPLFPEVSAAFLPVLAMLGVASILYAGWMASLQTDLKRLVAYISVAHLGLIVLGVAACHAVALQGALIQLFNHGITAAGLFVLVALVERRAGSRQLFDTGGLWSRAPRLGAVFLFFSLATLGLPGLNIFSGEILVLAGAFQVRPWWGAAGLVGVFLAACYTLRMVQSVLWGKVRGRDNMSDLQGTESLLLAPLTALVVLGGMYPAPFLALVHGPVSHLLDQFVAKGGLP